MPPKNGRKEKARKENRQPDAISTKQQSCLNSRHGAAAGGGARSLEFGQGHTEEVRAVCSQYVIVLPSI